ncbi:hypothetical protein B0T18DRAFT_421622 [Schizothecium vesticola]|uniref:Uncharacterized protein n=1 Tax=Schizothecium vesticola TaxID=314040 RepID=A0AA40BPX7_9PEZI|nr:hypothetical protein B0T18DRAFT_421622 [Schizothecium vesticola]
MKRKRDLVAAAAAAAAAGSFFPVMAFAYNSIARGGDEIWGFCIWWKVGASMMIPRLALDVTRAECARLPVCSGWAACVFFLFFLVYTMHAPDPSSSCLIPGRSGR